MMITELQNRINCWLWLYEKIGLEASSSPLVWNLQDGNPFPLVAEMMINVALFEIPKDFVESAIAEDLCLAKELAQTGDCNRMNYISDLLKSVNIAIARKGLHVGKSIN